MGETRAGWRDEGGRGIGISGGGPVEGEVKESRVTDPDATRERRTAWECVDTALDAGEHEV